jgi:hypothetical protein
MPGPKGSPRTAMAASLLIATPDLTIEEAMRGAKYNQKVAQGKQQKKNVSKKKNHILAASGKENISALVQISQGSGMETSTATSTLSESNRNSNATGSSKKGAAQKTVLAEVPPLRLKVLASSSRKMPNQVLKAHKERNHVDEVRKVAHDWALKKLAGENNCASSEHVA